MVLRWGLAGAGNISHDFATALSTLAEDHHKIVAVAARDVGRAENFAKLHNIPKAYGSYEELAGDPNIDIVYVGTVNTHHMNVGVLMLNSGKHVLVETAFCLNENQARNLIKTAREKKLFCMEAIWSRFLPSYQYVRETMEKGTLGDIKEVKVTFGYPLLNVDRVMKKSTGGGSLLDLGIFAIQFSQWVFNQPPEIIKATGDLNEDGCDLTIDAELKYPNDGKSLISLSLKEMLENSAVVIGTKGQITLKNFWCSDTVIDIDGSVKSWSLPETKHQTNYPNSVGFRYEAEEIRKCIEGGKIESAVVTHDESLLIARIEDEIRKQVGVTFDEDNIKY